MDVDNLQGEADAIDRMLTLEIVRVTEQAAIAAAHVRGRGDERLADKAAVVAMRAELNRLRIRGRIVIGEGGARRGFHALCRRGGRDGRRRRTRRRLRPA
jgi:hypothetical protein